MEEPVNISLPEAACCGYTLHFMRSDWYGKDVKAGNVGHGSGHKH